MEERRESEKSKMQRDSGNNRIKRETTEIVDYRERQ